MVDFPDYRNGCGSEDWLKNHMTCPELMAAAAAKTCYWAEPTPARPLGYLLRDYADAALPTAHSSSADPFQDSGDSMSREQHELLTPIANVFRDTSRSSRCQLVMGTHTSLLGIPGGLKGR